MCIVRFENNLKHSHCVCITYLDVLEGDGLLTVQLHLLLNGLKNNGQRSVTNVCVVGPVATQMTG